MHGGADGTYDLARRLLAMHAQHRLKIAFWRVGVAFKIAVDPQPVHLPLVDHLRLADDGNIVFRLTGDHAGVAPDACIKIHAHRPGGRPRRDSCDKCAARLSLAKLGSGVCRRASRAGQSPCVSNIKL